MSRTYGSAHWKWLDMLTSVVCWRTVRDSEIAIRFQSRMVVVIGSRLRVWSGSVSRRGVHGPVPSSWLLPARAQRFHLSLCRGYASAHWIFAGHVDQRCSLEDLSREFLHGRCSRPGAVVVAVASAIAGISGFALLRRCWSWFDW